MVDCSRTPRLSIAPDLPAQTSLRITFVLPGVGVTGGVRAVFEHAQYLSQRHEVRVVYPYVMSPETSHRKMLRRKRISVRLAQLSRKLPIEKDPLADWFGERRFALLHVPYLRRTYIPRGDRLIATAAWTAPFVHSCPPSKGEKYYFIQHYETWSWNPDKVDETWRLPMHRIVVSEWLARIARERLNVPIAGIVPAGFDPKTFYDMNVREEGAECIVSMMHSDQEWKGVADGLDAVDAVRRDHPELSLWLFGVSTPPALPEGVRFFLQPTQSLLREIYSRSHIFLAPSWHEGFGMPALEAMACGAAAVCTRVGAVPEYTRPGRSALVVAPRDIRAMTNALKILVQQPEVRRKIAKVGNGLVQRYHWRYASEKFERLLNQSPVTDAPDRPLSYGVEY